MNTVEGYIGLLKTVLATITRKHIKDYTLEERPNTVISLLEYTYIAQDRVYDQMAGAKMAIMHIAEVEGLEGNYEELSNKAIDEERFAIARFLLRMGDYINEDTK